MSGCIPAVMDENGNRHSLSSFFVAKSVQEGKDVLVAKLTGSIYETGDYITVFGACLTARDDPVNASVSLTVYYPNGTLAIQTTNVSMIKVGYWYYTDVMGTTVGTYLTIWNCTYRGQTALAFGEWQNPVWVNRLENLSFHSNVTVNISLICEDNESLCNKIERGFNQTNDTLWIIYDKIENISVEINISINDTLIEYGICISNASVDRNDSYLAHIVQSIARGVGAPISYDFTVNEVVKVPIRGSNWRIKVYLLDEYGEWLTRDEGTACNVTVCDNAVTTVYNMTWVEGTGGQGNAQTQCGHNYEPPACTALMIQNGFYYQSHRIVASDFNYSVSCSYMQPYNYTYPVC